MTHLLLLAAVAASPMTWGADAQGGAPYVFQDPTDPNRLTGFEVELAEQLAHKLGRTSQPVHGPWDKLLELLVRGDFELALNGIEVTDDKKQLVALSNPYFAAAEVLTVRRGDGAAPRTLQRLQGRRVGTLPASMAERIAQRAGADVRTYEGGQDELYDDLKLGRLDAVLLDAPASRFYGELDDALEAIHGDFGTVRYAIALRKDDAALLANVNSALGELGREGALRALYERWGLWSAENARLLGDEALEAQTPPVEWDRWRQAVGKLPSLSERMLHRYPSMLPMLLTGAGLTLLVSLCAMVLAVALGSGLALGRRYGPRPARLLCGAYIEFFRGTPLLIQLTMVYFGLPELGLRLSPFVAGVVALGLNYAAAEAENYRAGLEAVPHGQQEAAQVLGLSTWQMLRFVIGPQAVRVSIPPMTNDFIALLKDSSLVSIVTLTELTKSYTNLATSTRDHLGLGVLVALLYLLLGLPFATLARGAERHFGRHLRRAAR